MTYSAATPAEVRALIRTGQLTAPTTGYSAQEPVSAR